MLKFGRIVDIDSLGTITGELLVMNHILWVILVSRAVVEARESVRQNEMKLAREEHQMQQEVQLLKADLAELVKLNTHK